MDATSFDDDSLVSLRTVLYGHGLQHVVLPTCCSVYVLPPNGGYAVYSITFSPGAFHNESGDGMHGLPKLDNSLLLLRNNLTSLETVLLRTITQTAAIGLRSALLPTLDSDVDDGVGSVNKKTKVSGGVPTSFPTSSGSPYDATANFNPSLSTSPECDTGTGAAGFVNIARYDLRTANGDVFCPVAVAPTPGGVDLSVCRISVVPPSGGSQNELPLRQNPALFEFNFHEGNLKTLCKCIGTIKISFPS